MKYASREYKVVSLRDRPGELMSGDSAAAVADYWRKHVSTNRYLDPDRECLVVLLLNVRHNVQGHSLVGLGTLTNVLVHPREVFRAAIVASAASVVMMHNHPSGDPTPSKEDIKITRDMIRAGQVLKLDLLDHVIMGAKANGRNRDFVSLRELGCFDY